MEMMITGEAALRSPSLEDARVVLRENPFLAFGITHGCSSVFKLLTDAKCDEPKLSSEVKKFFESNPGIAIHLKFATLEHELQNEPKKYKNWSVTLQRRDGTISGVDFVKAGDTKPPIRVTFHPDFWVVPGQKPIDLRPPIPIPGIVHSQSVESASPSSLSSDSGLYRSLSSPGSSPSVNSYSSHNNETVFHTLASYQAPSVSSSPSTTFKAIHTCNYYEDMDDVDRERLAIAEKNFHQRRMKSSFRHSEEVRPTRFVHASTVNKTKTPTTETMADMFRHREAHPPDPIFAGKVYYQIAGTKDAPSHHHNRSINLSWRNHHYLSEVPSQPSCVTPKSHYATPKSRSYYSPHKPHRFPKSESYHDTPTVQGATVSPAHDSRLSGDYEPMRQAHTDDSPDFQTRGSVTFTNNPAYKALDDNGEFPNAEGDGDIINLNAREGATADNEYANVVFNQTGKNPNKLVAQQAVFSLPLPSKSPKSHHATHKPKPPHPLPRFGSCYNTSKDQGAVMSSEYFSHLSDYQHKAQADDSPHSQTVASAHGAWSFNNPANQALDCDNTEDCGDIYVNTRDGAAADYAKVGFKRTDKNLNKEVVQQAVFPPPLPPKHIPPTSAKPQVSPKPVSKP